MKICTKCKQEKPFVEFHRRNNLSKSKDGYNQQCKTCTKEGARLSYIKNREDHLKRRREKYIKDPSFHMFHEAKKRAKAKGIPFTIDKEDIKIPDVCPILGIPLYVGTGQQSDNSPSLDRFVPLLGYVKGNVNVISNKANNMKSNGTSEDVLKLYTWMKQQEGKTA